MCPVVIHNQLVYFLLLWAVAQMIISETSFDLKSIKILNYQ